jgi:hypothetical protein
MGKLPEPDKENAMPTEPTIRFAERMTQLPPYLFGMINKMKMERANVAVTPGAGFGEEGDGHLRLALVENENRIRQGLKQMRRALAEMETESVSA